VSDVLDLIGEELTRAARRQVQGSRPGRRTRQLTGRLLAAPHDGRRRAWWRSPRPLGVVLAALVVSAGAAYGAVRLIGIGSPVRPTGPLNPAVGEGIPAAGGSRLLALRVADPGGGPPWGVRIVHTTRGFVCLQVGRIEDGKLGELGIDDAFRDDGQFHPLPPDVLPNPAIGFSVGDNAMCGVAGRTFSAMAFGVDRNAAPLTRRAAPPRRYRREISYGLLGPHALSVTYKTAHGQRTTPVERGTGVFLLVQHGAHPQPGVGVMVAQGFGRRNAEHAGPNGVLTAVTYRFGGLTCSDSRDPRAAHACPRPSKPPATGRVNLHDPLHVALDIRHGLVFGAQLHFTAPYAVTSGREQYETELHLAACRDHSAIVGITRVDRNLDSGSTIRVNLPYVFSNSCNRSAKITVVFYRSSASTPQSIKSTEIGSITIHEPQGTKSANPPIPRHRSR
jgi:hypothetical protein